MDSGVQVDNLATDTANTPAESDEKQLVEGMQLKANFWMF